MVNNQEIKLLDAFAGIGALHKSLKNLGLPIKIMALSEIDIDAIISYAAIHIKDFENVDFDYPSDDEMRDWLIKRNIGYDFTKKKSKVLRLKQNKLKQVYKASVLLNNLGDISSLNPSELPDFDLFNFSFPCTDISVAGHQKGMTNEDGTHTRSGLYVFGMNVIKSKKPKYVMIENVKGLIGKKFIGEFYSIIKELEGVGYNCHYPKNDKGNPVCLNAKDYGVPQNRERIFVICIRHDVDNKKFEFPKPLNIETKIKDILEQVVDKKYYINKALNMKMKSNYIQYDNSGKGYESQAARLYYTDSAMGSLPYRNSGDKTQIIEKDKKDISNNSIDGLNYIKSLGCIKRIGGLFDTESRKREAGAVYDVNGFSPTLNTMQGGYRQPLINTCLDDFKLRKLTPVECWRLMGFETEDCFKARKQGISDSQLYKQAGNSIVVNVLYYIFKNLFKDYIK